MAPPIVITDLKMPRMGGFELLDRLASGQYAAGLVIVMTACGTIDSAVTAMKLGACDYITKPIDLGRLRSILQNASILVAVKTGTAEN
jgi:DNA-binding NtrC family response regulator